MDIELYPRLLTGKIAAVTEMSVKIELKGKMGILHLPLRSVFTDKKPAPDDPVEIYISYAKIL